MDRIVPVVMLQLAIMNHILMKLDDESQARRRRKAIRFWVCPSLSADRRLQWPTGERAKDGRQHLIFQLYENRATHV